MLSRLVPCILLLAFTVPLAAKPKSVSFGKANPVKWFAGPEEKNAQEMKVRALLVNGEAKEFATGPVHEVTDKLFVVRRAVRLNDSLPGDEPRLHRWRWQPAGWLLVDRATARIAKLTLPEFDPVFSEAAWYRDFAAYCGVSENGEKLDALVVQLGSRKPVMKKFIRAAKSGDTPDSECDPPTWERQPMRVTFRPKGAEAFTYAVREHAIQIEPTPAEAASEEEK